MADYRTYTDRALDIVKSKTNYEHYQLSWNTNGTGSLFVIKGQKSMSINLSVSQMRLSPDSLAEKIIVMAKKHFNNG